MISGRETLQEIDDHVLKAQSRIEDADRELEKLNGRVNELHLETTRQYRQLAKFRLDEMNAGSMASRLDRAHQAVPAFMKQRRQALAGLEEKIRRARQRQQALEQQRQTLRDARDKAADLLEQQIAKSKAALEQIEAYRQQLEKTAAAAQVARRAAEKASRSEADLAEKGQPYRHDTLFMYLWQRRFLTPDYRHGGIIRMLDEWVARLIHFKTLRADYHMLNELPRRLRTHAAETEEEARHQHQQQLSMEKQAAERDGIPALQAELEKAQAKLEQVNDDIEAQEKHHQDLLHRKNAFSAGKDEYTRKAVDLMVAELTREDTLALLRQARATPQPEDDAIVMRLQQIEKERQTLTRRISELKSQQAQQRHALEELAQLRGKFRRSDYDARYSSFPTNLGLGILLGEILGGGRSAGSAWDQIDHAQQWDLPGSGGSGGGGFGSGGGFGGFGGFGSGGGFGGGGFSSGGGF